VRSIDAASSVIVMTSRACVAERIRLLDLGADDHLTKPVDAGEVAARVRAVTRRMQRARSSAVLLEHGPLCLQVDRRSATWHGSEVPLTNMEFWLLETLVRRRQQVLSRTALEEMLYGWGDETSSNTVEVHVHHLRRKLDRRLIHTVRGVGYQIGREDELVGRTC
jgi:DNA-binding response OmpR family regulator